MANNGNQGKSHHTGVRASEETLNVQFDEHLTFTTLIDLIK